MVGFRQVTHPFRSPENQRQLQHDTRVSKVAVIGAGAMGRGIAQIAAQAGSQVWLYDTQPGATAKAREALCQQWDKLLEKGKLTAEAVAGHKSRLLEAASLQDLAGCDLVVEAIVEKIDIKKAVFADLEKSWPRTLCW